MSASVDGVSILQTTDLSGVERFRFLKLLSWGCVPGGGVRSGPRSPPTVGA